MLRNKIIEELMERKLFNEEDYIVLADGFEEAIIGVTATKPIKAIYDYWMCLDIAMNDEDLNFDEALDWLEDFVLEDLGEHSPIYIKKINNIK